MRKSRGVGEAVGADGTAVGQRERAAVVLAHESARRAVQQLDLEDHAARDDADLARLDIDDAEFGAEAQGHSPARTIRYSPSALKKYASVIDCGDEQHMRRHADLGVGIARRRDGAQPVEESELAVREWRRVPAQLADGQVGVLARRRRPHQALVDSSRSGPNA